MSRGLTIMIALTAAAPAWSVQLPIIRDEAKLDRHKQQVETIMSLSTEQVRDMVPTASGGIYFTDCPNCEYGAEEAECFNTTWDPRTPKQLVCRGCGEVYPNNAKDPDDRFDTVVASELVPGYALAEWVVGAVRFPDNRLIPVNDTWAAHGKTNTFRRATARKTRTTARTACAISSPQATSSTPVSGTPPVRLPRDTARQGIALQTRSRAQRCESKRFWKGYNSGKIMQIRYLRRSDPNYPN